MRKNLRDACHITVDVSGVKEYPFPTGIQPTFERCVCDRKVAANDFFFDLFKVTMRYSEGLESMFFLMVFQTSSEQVVEILMVSRKK